MAKNIKQRNVSQKKKTDTSNGPLETTRRMNSASHMTVHQRRLAEDKQEREKLVLWRHPISTLHYFLLETGCLLYSCAVNLWQKRRTVIFILLTFLALVFVYNVEGFHQKMIKVLRKKILWCVYWVGLGILSSVGLGTGLHTFVLYLGPHIASVTLAAFECMSLDFPEPPYPDKIICPETISPVMSIWMIMSKVRLEAIMWGAGTAIGELPPYFMARAARLSGSDLEDEEFEELEELLKEKTAHPEELSFLEKLKVGIHNLIKKVGFFGILACASIPNPLFDLAGITCGHFLIPFWTFFGASLIGKAIIKMHIQKLFVIILFSQHHAEQLVDLIRVIPFVGQSMQKPFDNWLKEQKNKLHHKPDTDLPENTNLLSRLFEKVIIVMVVYFVLSIINSMAQSYHKRLCKMWRQDE